MVDQHYRCQAKQVGRWTSPRAAWIFYLCNSFYNWDISNMIVTKLDYNYKIQSTQRCRVRMLSVKVKQIEGISLYHLSPSALFVQYCSCQQYMLLPSSHSPTNLKLITIPFAVYLKIQHIREMLLKFHVMVEIWNDYGQQM